MRGFRRHRRAATWLGMLLLTAACVVAAGPARAQAPPPPPLPLVREGATVKLSDHVHVILDARVGMVPNIGFVVGTKGALVIDPGMGRATATPCCASSGS